MMRLQSARRSGRVAATLGALLALLLVSAGARSARLKDLAFVEGVRPNQLVGYGLVIGLDGTGDTERASFTRQSIAAALSRVGVRIDPQDLYLRNVAAVMVTATLPAFSEPGTRLDVVVSSIGNARSLRGGTLVMTPLAGVDGRTYGIAQGPLQVAQGDRTSYGWRRGHLNVGRIAGGALVERPVSVALGKNERLVLHLRRPDFSTASRMAEAINQQLGGQPGPARAITGGTVEITTTEEQRGALPSFIASLESLQVEPDTSARVVINGRTGTIVLGGEVRISPVAVAHRGLKVEVREPRGGRNAPDEQPAPSVVRERDRGLDLVAGGATLAELVAGLNALGAKPDDLVAILQTIAASGALHGELEVL